MKTIKLIEKEGNCSVGIFQEVNGSFLVTTFAKSKSFKTLAAAEKFLSAQGF